MGAQNDKVPSTSQDTLAPYFDDSVTIVRRAFARWARYSCCSSYTNPIRMLLSLEEGYILPAVDLFKTLFSAHPITFVCEISFTPHHVFIFDVGLLHHLSVVQLLSLSRVHVCSFIYRVSFRATLTYFVLVSSRLPRFQLH